jgi:hypothetical protein
MRQAARADQVVKRAARDTQKLGRFIGSHQRLSGDWGVGHLSASSTESAHRIGYIRNSQYSLTLKKGKGKASKTKAQGP